jgi:hypothetical protein
MAFVLAAALCVLPAQAQKQYRDATSGFMNETTFVASAAYTTSSSTITPVDIGSYASGVLMINVTAVAGTSTPTLTVNFAACASSAGQQSAPANANCTTHTAGTGITATGVYLIKVDHFPRWNTVNYTISGTTPSFTFSVVGYFKPTS